MKERQLRQLGLELKQERERRNIELEKIADQTKININFLNSIEAGEFDFLPETYVRYFLKSYLQKLGRNTEKFLTRYDDITDLETYRTTTDEDLRKSKVKNNAPTSWSQFINNIKKLKKRYLSIFCGAVILVILVAIISLPDKKDKKLSLDSEKYNQSITEQDSQLVSFSSLRFVKRNLNLNIIAQKKTWIQIAIDDSVTQEYIFKRGDSAIWKARDKFLIKLGNAAGVRLYLNGNDLGQLGKELEVVNLLLTKDGLQRNMF